MSCTTAPRGMGPLAWDQSRQGRGPGWQQTQAWVVHMWARVRMMELLPRDRSLPR